MSTNEIGPQRGDYEVDFRARPPIDAYEAVLGLRLAQPQADGECAELDCRSSIEARNRMIAGGVRAIEHAAAAFAATYHW